jgi:hypothetical protein
MNVLSGGPFNTISSSSQSVAEASQGQPTVPEQKPSEGADKVPKYFQKQLRKEIKTAIANGDKQLLQNYC